MSTTTRTLAAGAAGTAVGLAILWGVASQVGPDTAEPVDLPTTVTAEVDDGQYRYEASGVTWAHPAGRDIPDGDQMELCVHRHDPAVHAPADGGDCGPTAAGHIRRAQPDSPDAGGGPAAPADR